MGFPGGLEGKESTYNVGDLGSILGLGRSPGGGHGNPFQYSCLENPHGQRSQMGYSPWGCKELDTAEHLSTHRVICKVISICEVQMKVQNWMFALCYFLGGLITCQALLSKKYQDLRNIRCKSNNLGLSRWPRQ